MFGGMNPKQMASMMKQMGIKSEEVDCSRVIFEKSDGTKMIVENPQVTQVEMQGQMSFQVAGEVKKQGVESDEKSDIELIMEKTGASKHDAEDALLESGGDLAEAIVKLQK
jgi:nascent polypeptide-associated complex subunit alpha